MSSAYTVFTFGMGISSELSDSKNASIPEVGSLDPKRGSLSLL